MSASYEFADFRLDGTARALSFRGNPVKLTAKAFAVLALLAERSPDVVTRADFEAVIWPDGFIEPANLTQTIYMLRKAFAGCGAPSAIETVNGRGYRLAVAASPASPASALESARPARRAQVRWRLFASLVAIAVLAALLGLSRASSQDTPAAIHGTGTAHGYAARNANV